MSNPPRVSVVLAVCNGARHLERSLASMAGQTFADFELVLIDDGSSDSTPDILSAFERSEPRAIVVRQENRGLTASLNRGIAIARGSYIARQDADDISLPERFGRQVAFLDAHPDVAAVGSGADVIDGSGAVIGTLTTVCAPDSVKRGLMTLRATPVHGSMMMRREALVAAGGYREAFRYGQDYDLWLRLVSRSAIDNLPEVLYRWRMDRGAVYSTRRIEQLKYAGLALGFAHERLAFGDDSYESFRGCGGDMDRFNAQYRLGGRVHAIWGELLLRGVGNSRVVRSHFRRALGRGFFRPWPAFLCGWTHLGLPWPGGKPLSVAEENDAHA